MKIGICDDEIRRTEEIEEFINDSLYSKEVTEITLFYSGAKLLRDIESGIFYNIIFLDIEIGSENGIEIGKKIRDLDRDCLIIFVTNYTKYVMKSFEILPFRYVEKPIDKKKFTHIINEAIKQAKSKKNYIVLKKGTERYNLKHTDIVCITSEFGRIINFSMQDDKTVSVYGKIKDIEKELCNINFVRINRGTIVNFDYILVFSDSLVQLKTGEVFTVSKGCKDDVKKLFDEMIERKVGV